MVDIFRNSEAAGAVVDEALALEPMPKVIWMQLTVRNDEAAARAEAAGVKVVMNRCPKIEFGRLSGEIGWAGVNSRTLSSKRPARDTRGFQRLGLRPGARPGRLIAIRRGRREFLTGRTSSNESERRRRP